MRIFGIGIDVVEVGRMAAAIERHGERFLTKIFTAAERADCERRKNPAPHFAARFAAKEAAAKALGTGIGAQAGLHDLEVLADASGRPSLRLSGAAARFAADHRISAIHISLTHTAQYAAANAVAVCDD